MATDLKSPPDTSVTELVSGIARDAQDLIKQQFQLFKYEVRDDLRKTLNALLLLAIGAAVGLVALLLIIFMTVYLLQWAVPSLPLWACFGICGAVALAIAGGLAYAGAHKFTTFNPLPDQTAQALKENVRWITQPK